MLKNTHLDQDTTKTRLIKIEANRTRPGGDFPSFETRPRRDKFQNLVRDRDETESLGTFSLKTKTRPRLSSFTAPSPSPHHLYVKDYCDSVLGINK